MTKDNDKERLLYTLYKTNQTEKINYALRLPILLFNGLVMLPLLFWLLFKAFDRRVASIGIVFIGINPILIGISQIINPDALLWSFSAGALFSFFALLKTNQKKFIVLTGILTGFALLSKYTANLLFVFYIIIGFSWLLYEKTENINQWLRTLLIRYASILLLAVIVFSIFLPAVLIDINLFTYGTLLSPPLKPIIMPLGILFIFLIFDAFVLKAKITSTIINWLRKINTPLLLIATIPLLFLITFALINAWSDAHFITLDNLKELVAHRKELKFPMLEGLPAPIYFLGEVAVQSFNIIFSFTPILIASTFLTIILIFLRKLPKYRSTLFFCLIVPFLFFIGGILAEVFVNTRYAIILHPVFALLTGIGLSQIIPSKKHVFTIFIILFFSVQSLSIYLSAPYYFNYQNVFLPKKFTLADSWSYGIFEASQWLNALNNANDLVVWSDRKAVCYYFTGHCIERVKIDYKTKMPDYFIITRRGTLHHHFKWIDSENTPFSIDEFYDNTPDPVWRLNILNRPQNYIKIIKTKDIINN
jgi:4-amino-4-deoxy-L-arabinose transferase-like glycosyltransferase